MQLKIPSIFLILILAGLATLGFLGIGLIGDGGHHVCPISVIAGNDCPPVSDAITSVSHHLSGLQRLTQPVIEFNPTLLALFILLLASLLFSSRLSRQIIFEQHFSYQRFRLVKELKPKQTRQLLSWIALHNKRSPHALQWVHDKI